MHEKYLKLLRYKMVHGESFINEVKAVLYNPFAYSEYRLKVLVPKDYDFELISDYLYFIKDSNNESNDLVVTLLAI
jgi:proteasome assembly chaperone (PAC2) family protein